MLKVQHAERQQYLQSKCWEDKTWRCSGRMYFFDFMDGEILAYSASGVALAGVGFSSIVLNRNPRQNPKTSVAMYLLNASLFGCYAVYYSIFSYAQEYFSGWPGQLIPLKNLYCCY